MPAKPRGYHAHETVYQRIEREGGTSWGDRAGQPELTPESISFLNESLAQSWAPTPGRAIELGCGTGPMLRWLNGRGWSGSGVDVSPTAIRIARRLSVGTSLGFRVGDVTNLDSLRSGTFDLALDGHCLHCLTTVRDRAAFFREVRRLLRPGGLLVVLTMATPVRLASLRRKHGPFVANRTWAPLKDARRYRGARRFDGVWHIPARYMEHWRTTLSHVKRHGFDTKLFRVQLATDDLPNSGLSVAALRK